MKRAEGIVEILEAFDLTGSFRAAAELARVLRPGGLYLPKTPTRRLAEAFSRLRGLHDSYFWHPAMLSPGTFGHGGAWGTQAWIDPVRGVAYLLMGQRANFPNSDASDVRRAFQEAAAKALETRRN